MTGQPLRVLVYMQAILGPLQDMPCLIIQSGADEALPEALRQSGAVQELGQRMLQAMQLGPAQGRAGKDQLQEGGAAVGSQAAGLPAGGGDGSGRTSGGACSESLQLRVIEGAGHACAEHVDPLVKTVCDFLKLLPLKQRLG